jgi:hypothetical protein
LVAIPPAVSPRGLTTGAIPCSDGGFQIDFDFVEHRLRPRSVATFYRELMAGLQDRGLDMRIRPRPVEVAEAIPFAEHELHASYEPLHAELSPAAS